MPRRAEDDQWLAVAVESCSRGVGHEYPVEEGLVGVEQPDQLDAALKIRRLGPEVLQDSLNLGLLGVDTRW